MTAKANHSTPATICPAPLVLFGLDSRGKPKGGPVWQGARRSGHQGRKPVAAAGSGRPGPEDRRIDRDCRLAGSMPLAAPSCRSFAATSTTSCSPPPEMATPSNQPTERALRNAAGSRPPGGSAPRLPQNWQAIGLGDLVLASQDRREDGWYEAIVVEQTVTCSPYAGVTTRGSAGLCAIGFGLDCSIPGPDRQQKTGNQRKPQATQSTTNRSQQTPTPTASRCPRIGTRSISIISCWPKTTANGGLVGSHPGREGR